MDLVSRQRALQASDPSMDHSQTQRILGQPQEATLAQRAPDITARPDFQAVQQGREREVGVQERLSELDPRIVGAEASRAGRIAGAERQPEPSLDRIAAEAEARARGTAAGSPAEGVQATEGQRTAAAFFNTASSKKEIIDGFTERLFSDNAFNTFQRILPNTLQSADMQSYLKLLESIAFDITVGTSGAQFSAAELQKRIDQITPQVGDRRETIETKMAILESGLDALRQKAGPAVGSPPEGPVGGQQQDLPGEMSDADLRSLLSDPGFGPEDEARLTEDERQRLQRIRGGR